jgi:hypothetical protein
MLALFSLRLALGMLACLPLLPAHLVQPRFYRTHLLTALGLCCLAFALVYETAACPLLACLGAAIALTFLGSILWRVEGAPGGQLVVGAVLCVLFASIWQLDISGRTGDRTAIAS